MKMLDKMYRLLRRKPSQAKVWRPKVAPNERIYAIGDIHGRADLLVKLHASIDKDANIYGGGKTKRIIYLGDYIDRGLESKSVIDILTTRRSKAFELVFLKGNHEDLFLRSLQDATIWPKWLALGGDATVLSYGLCLSGQDDHDGYERMRHDLLRQIPLEHRRFLESLQLSFRSGDYLFVHAGIRPNIPLDMQDPHDLMWIREDFLHHKELLGIVVVHGHSISLKPEFFPERIGIDTGAYATNALSCVVLDGTHRSVISTGPIKQML